jgi:hypothetical protein
MTARASMRNEGIRMQDAFDLLRESALVKEISGEPALTSKGERFPCESSENRHPALLVNPVRPMARAFQSGRSADEVS